MFTIDLSTDFDSSSAIQQAMSIISSYTGDLSGCLSNCSNKGACAVDSLGKFFCNCSQPYSTGRKCEIDRRLCSSYTCINNGICIDIYNSTQNSYSFSCNCSSSFYYGTYCQFKIDVCANETCSGNGFCYDNSSVPTCKCFLNYEGKDCGTKSAKLKVIEKVISVSSIIAIICIISVYLIAAASDIHTRFFIKKKSLKKKKLNKPKNKQPGKFKYIKHPDDKKYSSDEE